MLTRAAAAAATVLPVNIFLCGAPGATLHYQHLIWAAQYKYHVSHQVKDLYWPKNVSFLHAKKRFLWLSRICYCATYCVVGFYCKQWQTNASRPYKQAQQCSNVQMFKCSSHLYVLKQKIYPYTWFLPLPSNIATSHHNLSISIHPQSQIFFHTL